MGYQLPSSDPDLSELKNRYVGKWEKNLDPTVGVVLMGARSYDSSIGRFLSRDAIEKVDLNAYVYAGGDPINGYDLDGHLSLKGLKRWATNRHTWIGWATSAATAFAVAGCLATVGCGFALAAGLLGLVYASSVSAHYAIMSKRQRAADRGRVLLRPLPSMAVGAFCGATLGVGCIRTPWQVWRTRWMFGAP